MIFNLLIFTNTTVNQTVLLDKLDSLYNKKNNDKKVNLLNDMLN
jgi:hypothetical protein